MKRILWVKDGILQVTEPGHGISIEQVLEKYIPIEYKSSAKIVDTEIIPSDRYFREAWTFESNKINIDIPKAKEIHKDKLRIEREPLLKQTDIDFMKVFESGTIDNVKLQQIATEKLRLRDITKEVDKAKTIADILKVKL